MPPASTSTQACPRYRTRGERSDQGSLALGALGASLGWLIGAPALGLAGRWTLVAGLAIWAWRRRSLTTWILVSMVVGVSVGYDWPETGPAVRVLSQVFIRMIKTIIAPLLFATLVVGIAGHPNLRHVGRMGVKALVYFALKRPELADPFRRYLESLAVAVAPPR